MIFGYMMEKIGRGCPEVISQTNKVPMATKEWHLLPIFLGQGLEQWAGLTMMELFGCLAVLVFQKAHNQVSIHTVKYCQTYLSGPLNDVWKYENDILKEIDSNNEKEEKLEDLTIEIHTSNFIHIHGKVKGSNIQLQSKEINIYGIVELLD
jgi:hypothetical protein